MTEYALAKNQEKSEVPCPVCRHVQPAVVDYADDYADTLQPSVAYAAMPEVVESPVAEPAVASAEPEVAEPVVANTGRGGGRAKAKGRGKAKAKARQQRQKHRQGQRHS